MWIFAKKNLSVPSAGEALVGRDDEMEVPARHYVLGTALRPPFPAGTAMAIFGMGCFWGAEKQFWQLPGVHSTQVGYAGGHTRNPTYREVCSGQTGHTEVVRVVFEPARIAYADLVRQFFEGHDPTQHMRQGADVGTQYRSALYWYDETQRATAEATRAAYQPALRANRYGDIVTETGPAPVFYYAEAYHQQYLAKNPDGYCGHGGTGVSCPLPRRG